MKDMILSKWDLAGMEMRQYFPVLAKICQAGLEDASPEVQRVALQVVTGLGSWAADDTHVSAVRTLLLPLLKARLCRPELQQLADARQVRIRIESCEIEQHRTALGHFAALVECCQAHSSLL